MSDLALVLLNPTVALNYFTLSAGVDALTPSMPDQVGPRLEDLKVTSSTRGADIKRVSGTSRIAGNIIWSSGFKETRHEDEIGKGGSETVTVVWYTYSCSFTIGLCEGEIQGVRRVWADAKLIYDIGDEASATQVLVSKQAGVTIYNGDEDQLPPSIMQSDKGISSTPASRGLAYIEFDDMQLEEYGNRIPNINVEVLSSASESYSFIDTETIAVGSSEWNNASHIGMTNWDGVKGYYVYAPYETSIPTANNIAIEEYIVTDDTHIKIRQFNIETVKHYAGEQNLSVGVSNTSDYIVTNYQPDLDPPYTVRRHCQRVKFGTAQYTDLGVISLHFYSLLYWAMWDDLTVVMGDQYGGSEYTLLFHHNGTNSLLSTGIDIRNDMTDVPASILTMRICISRSFLFIMVGSTSTPKILKYNKDDFSFISEFAPGAYLTFDVYNDDDILISADDEIRLFKWGNASYSIHSSTLSEPNFTSTFITAASHYKNYIFPVDDSYSFWYSYASSDPISNVGYKDLSSNAVTLSSVIAKLCIRAGLSLSDIDISTLTDNVTGQALISKDLASISLRGLLTAYNIKVYEADWEIKFIKIDEESPELIDNNDLGAGHETTTEVLTTNRVQSTELPRSINIQYASQLTDYQTSVQKAQRVITNV